MKNHKWNNNQCVRCGIKRKRYCIKTLMAIVNHPPWDVYKYHTGWAFSFDGKIWKYYRPNCIDLSEAERN